MTINSDELVQWVTRLLGGEPSAQKEIFRSVMRDVEEAQLSTMLFGGYWVEHLPGGSRVVPCREVLARAAAEAPKRFELCSFTALSSGVLTSWPSLKG